MDTQPWKNSFPDALQAVDRLHTQNLDRLSGGVSDLSKRGNVNLIIGIVFALIGIILLGWSLLAYAQQPIKPGLDGAFLSTLGLKLSIGVFLQVIAFFFLRLYRSCIIDIKYYKNEIANIQQRHEAVIIACMSNEPELLGGVIDKLMNTERNRILEKGQSSIGLENSVHLVDSDFQLVGEILKVVKGHRGENTDGKKPEEKKAK
ncbi:MAG: hypothetical protein P4L46_16110 [Fimbriimonas sp.]|nr:hypothetical protein [Fimbriimonas sp.]